MATMAAVCPECNGTGWKIVERDEVSGAVRCACVAVERASRVFVESDIPPLYRNASLENFLLPGDRNRIASGELSMIRTKLNGYVRNFPDPKKPGLLLMGRPGTGKTHLAVGVFREILDKGFGGLFFDYQTLLDRIRSSYDQASNTTDKEVYRVAMDKPVLLLDDLGAHRVTDWVEDTVTSIITARCNNRRPLIATTNLIDTAAGYITYEGTGSGKTDHRTTLTERIGERARSRLFEMCTVIKMPEMVDDFRLAKQGS